MFCWGITSLPILLSASVPGVDTINHTARLHVLAHINEGYQQFYQPNWVFIPNIAIDVLLVPLVKFLPALLVMKCFLIGLIGATALGFSWLNKELTSKELNGKELTGKELTGNWSPWGLIAFALSYHYVLGFGFINYLFGLCLGLFVLAWDQRSSPGWKSNLFLTASIPILFTVHMMAASMVGIAWIGLRILNRNTSPIQAKKGMLGILCGSIITVLLVLQIPSRTSHSGLHFDPFPSNLSRLANPLAYGSSTADYLATIILSALTLTALARGWITFKNSTWKVALGILLLACIAPQSAFSSAYVSARIPIWAVIIGLAGLTPTAKLSTQTAQRLGIAILALVAGRSADISFREWKNNAIHNQLAQDMQTIPEGALVYQITQLIGHSQLKPEMWNPSILHADCNLLLSRPCYVNNLFSMPYQQPLKDSSTIPYPLRDIYLVQPFNQQLEKEIAKIRSHFATITLENKQSHPIFLYIVRGENESIHIKDAESMIVRDRYVIAKISS